MALANYARTYVSTYVRTYSGLQYIIHGHGLCESVVTGVRTYVRTPSSANISDRGAGLSAYHLPLAR